MCNHHKYSDKHGHHYRAKCGKMGIGSLFLGALLVMVLWNALIPDLFGGPHLGYWQSFALLFLSRLFFGWGRAATCYAGQGHKGGRWREEFAAKMKEKFEEKTHGMSEEDKEKFKKGFTSGKWDVNLFEVEEEETDKGEDEPGDESPDDKGNKPEA